MVEGEDSSSSIKKCTLGLVTVQVLLDLVTNKTDLYSNSGSVGLLIISV